MRVDLWLGGVRSHGCYDLLAHREAWDKAGILHSDISTANIMININPENPKRVEVLLNDWDLCKWKDDKSEGPTQPTGRSVRVMPYNLLDSGLS